MEKKDKEEMKKTSDEAKVETVEDDEDKAAEESANDDNDDYDTPVQPTSRQIFAPKSWIQLNSTMMVS